MKSIIQQEILLTLTSTLSKRQLNEKSDFGNSISQTEQLEKACWNGLLNEILPGIIDKSNSGKSLSLWKIRHCHCFLDIQLSEYPLLAGKEFSINPYCFIEVMLNN